MTRAVMRSTRARVVFAGVLVAAANRPVFGQLDLLRPLKATRPNVILALDLSSRMQRDSLDVYLDPLIYSRTGEAFEGSIGADEGTTATAYRRRYVGLAWQAPGGDPRATCTRVEAIGDRLAAFGELDARTRIGRARAGRPTAQKAGAGRFPRPTPWGPVPRPAPDPPG